MILHEALLDIAAIFKLDAGDLLMFANEDEIGGWTTEPRYWNPGSIFGVEGQMLYALARAIRPAVIYEIGVGEGCSTSHLLAALKANGTGQLISAEWFTKPPKLHPGALIPRELRGVDHAIFLENGITLFKKAGKMMLWPDGRNRTLPEPNMFWDDGGHSWQEVAQSATLAMEILPPGGFYVIHDTHHPSHTSNIRGGLRSAGMNDMQFYLIDPADTGLGIWQKPVDAAPRAKVEAAPVEIEQPEPEPEEKPKRSTRRRTSKSGE